MVGAVLCGLGAPICGQGCHWTLRILWAQNFEFCGRIFEILRIDLAPKVLAEIIRDCEEHPDPL